MLLAGGPTTSEYTESSASSVLIEHFSTLVVSAARFKGSLSRTTPMTCNEYWFLGLVLILVAYVCACYAISLVIVEKNSLCWKGCMRTPLCTLSTLCLSCCCSCQVYIVCLLVPCVAKTGALVLPDVNNYVDHSTLIARCVNMYLQMAGGGWWYCGLHDGE